MTCRKTYEIDRTDSQYTKLKQGKTKLYVCTNCNTSIQQSANTTTGTSASDLDPYTEILEKRKS
ncbi:hypothetical protein MUN89_16895 [Halobacillus salinarum]|uniref:DUF2197 domain-containing protein n=2 Tax=Halobacillus salinarum TaxID=2932257 RepID=A0ABY4EIW8_9BACI|nr:hypothetical protein MUN89_16895 [Halobacillus salinarum]